jgi:hypothetical protein
MQVRGNAAVRRQRAAAMVTGRSAVALTAQVWKTLLTPSTDRGQFIGGDGVSWHRAWVARRGMHCTSSLLAAAGWRKRAARGRPLLQQVLPNATDRRRAGLPSVLV